MVTKWGLENKSINTPFSTSWTFFFIDILAVYVLNALFWVYYCLYVTIDNNTWDNYKLPRQDPQFVECVAVSSRSYVPSHNCLSRDDILPTLGDAGKIFIRTILSTYKSIFSVSLGERERSLKVQLFLIRVGTVSSCGQPVKTKAFF